MVASVDSEVVAPLTLREVAALCKVTSTACVRSWISKGVVGVAGPVKGGRLKHRVKLRAVRMPRGYHVRMEDLRTFLHVVDGAGGRKVDGGRRACDGGGGFSPATSRTMGSPSPDGSVVGDVVVGSNGKRYPV